MNDSVTVRDPPIISEDRDNDTVTVDPHDGRGAVTLSPGTVVSGLGEHYFEGTVDELQYDSAGEHYWVVFTDVTLGEGKAEEHTLPLGELVDQMKENGLAVSE
jgi:hypothetical protein